MSIPEVIRFGLQVIRLPILFGPNYMTHPPHDQYNDSLLNLEFYY